MSTVDTAIVSRRAKLESDIASAFAHRTYPGDEALVEGEPGCRGAEGEEVREFLRGKDWQQLVRQESSHQRDLSDCTAFLSPEGFTYYLPAFLTLALDVGSPYDAGETLAFQLWSFPEQVASRLSAEEKQVVVRVLETLAQEYENRKYTRNDARTALEHYWGLFTDTELGLA